MRIIRGYRVTREYLTTHNYTVFVFGDNLLRVGTAGGAKFRDLPNTHGFITKKRPSMEPEAFYTPDEYQSVFDEEANRLVEYVRNLPNTQFLVTRLGAGFANKFGIFETIIRPQLPKLLEPYDNVYLLWD